MAPRGEAELMEYRFQSKDNAITLGVSAQNGGWLVQMPDGATRLIQVRRTGDQLLVIPQDDTEGAKRIRAAAAQTARGIEVAWNGDVYLFATETGSRRDTTASQGSGAVVSPMPGIVVETLVKVGQGVGAYQPVAVVEAMKVIATLEAPFAGIVSSVHVQKGARVSQGDILVEITRSEAG
jgi:biotin carboxyl carrier protein